MMTPILQVALGGALGSVARHLVVAGAARLAGPGIGTFAVNVAGSFLIGVLAVMLLGPKGPAPAAPLLITGFLGGFTTFSAFSLDALRFWEAGQMLQAGLYVLGTVSLSIAAVALGAAFARGMLA